VGGKQILIGVYPGNSVAVPHLPWQVVVRFWTEVLPIKVGDVDGRFRVVDMGGTSVFDDTIKLSIGAPNVVMPITLMAQFLTATANSFEAQLQIGDEDWFRLGSMRVIHSEPTGIQA